MNGKLLISILAGVTTAQLTAMVNPNTRIVRAMPNTPCKVRLFFYVLTDVHADVPESQIREGMTVVSSIPEYPAMELDRQVILNIFSSIGRCRFLDEKHFDACTALSGSGPAFACIFLEAMADGGVMMGLPRAEALELAAQSEFNDTEHYPPVIERVYSIARCGENDFARWDSPCSIERCSHQCVHYHV